MSIDRGVFAFECHAGLERVTGEAVPFYLAGGTWVVRDEVADFTSAIQNVVLEPVIHDLDISVVSSDAATTVEIVLKQAILNSYGNVSLQGRSSFLANKETVNPLVVLPHAVSEENVLSRDANRNVWNLRAAPTFERDPRNGQIGHVVCDLAQLRSFDGDQLSHPTPQSTVPFPSPRSAAQQVHIGMDEYRHEIPVLTARCRAIGANIDCCVLAEAIGSRSGKVCDAKKFFHENVVENILDASGRDICGHDSGIPGREDGPGDGSESEAEVHWARKRRRILCQ